VPITKRRRFNELSNTEAVWFLPIQRHTATGQRFKDIPDSQRSTLLFSSEGSQTRVFALSSKVNPEQIGRIANITIIAAPFFQRSCVLHVTPNEVNLLDSCKYGFSFA
jgi:cleavage and polyadenylation specificity factor subunit 1